MGIKEPKRREALRRPPRMVDRRVAICIVNWVSLIYACCSSSSRLQSPDTFHCFAPSAAKHAQPQLIFNVCIFNQPWAACVFLDVWTREKEETRWLLYHTTTMRHKRRGQNQLAHEYTTSRTKRMHLQRVAIILMTSSDLIWWKRFWTDWIGLVCLTLVLDWLDWFGLADSGFGLTGLD